MIPLAATVAGWLLLFVVLLVLPPVSQPRRDERAAPGMEPPAVVSLLAGRLERDGFGVTLADLAARGWFRLSGTPGPASPASPAGPVMCVTAAETPAEPLAPYERRVMAHVARRAGVRGQVPAPALSDSFEGGESAFLKAFRDEVTADAERRGLTRPRLSGRRIGLLVLVLFVPAGATAIALDRPSVLSAGLADRVLVRPVAGHGRGGRQPASQRGRLVGPGAVARDGRRDAARPGRPRGARGVVPPWRQSYGGDERSGAYAAALGRAPGAVSAAPGTFVHAQVNLHNRDVTIDPVEPPAVARPLAGLADEQERAEAGGLPDQREPRPVRHNDFNQC